MKVGVLDILVDSPRTWINFAYRGVLKKRYASIMPQAVAVWCRRLGHEVSYAAYGGQHDPKRLLPDAPPALRILHVLRSLAMKKFLAALRRVGKLLEIEFDSRAFHEGRSSTLPDHHRRSYESKLGDCASLLSPAERTPEPGMP